LFTQVEFSRHQILQIKASLATLPSESDSIFDLATTIVSNTQSMVTVPLCARIALLVSLSFVMAIYTHAIVKSITGAAVACQFVYYVVTYYLHIFLVYNFRLNVTPNNTSLIDISSGSMSSQILAMIGMVNVYVKLKLI
jgi:hypothetical protein